MKRLRYLGVGTVQALALLLLLGATSLGCTKAATAFPGNQPKRDVLIQIATLDALSRGGYAGRTTVKQILELANFGIGTFTGLDGELIALDGVVYQASSNGVLRVASPQQFVPHATLTQFRSELSRDAEGPIDNYAALQAYLSSAFSEPDAILAFQLHGNFRTLKLRAPQKQTPPYPPLVDALKTQAVFEHKNLSGTFVGYRFPAYFGAVNAPGYHFHFVSDDRKHGGHVLEVAAENFAVSVEVVEEYQLTLNAAN